MAGIVSIVVARVGVKLASILEISIYKKKKKEKKQTNQRPCRGTWPASSCVVVAVVVLVIVAVWCDTEVTSGDATHNRTTENTYDYKVDAHM